MDSYTKTGAASTGDITVRVIISPRGEEGSGTGLCCTAVSRVVVLSVTLASNGSPSSYALSVLSIPGGSVAASTGREKEGCDGKATSIDDAGLAGTTMLPPLSEKKVRKESQGREYACNTLHQCSTNEHACTNRTNCCGQGAVVGRAIQLQQERGQDNRDRRQRLEVKASRNKFYERAEETKG